MTASTTSLFDALRASGVERLRFRRTPQGTHVVAARPDAAFEPAAALLAGSEQDLEKVRRIFEIGGHERLDLALRDPPGLRFLCAVHSTAAGAGAGGLRRRDLVTPEFEVIVDVLNLARAMTYKNAAAGSRRGGSKLVIHGSPLPEYERRLWLEAIAEEIDISGTITGPDVGFATQVFVELGALSSNVTGYRGGGTAEAAALGVHVAIGATLSALGRPASEAKVVVQGLGALGGALVRRLAADGAKLVVTDLDHRRIDDLLASLDPEARRLVGVVAPYQALDVE